MKEILNKLVNLQAQDTEIFRVQKLFETLSAEHEQAIKAKEDIEVELANINSEIEAQSSIKSQAQAVLEMNEERLKKTEDKSDAIQNQREFAAIQKERDTINEHMRKIGLKKTDSEEAIAKLEETAAEKNATLEEITTNIVRYEEERNASLAEEKNKMEAALKTKEEIRSNLSASWLSKYDRIIDYGKGLAVVPVINKSCGGCKLSIRPQLIITVQRTEVMVHCEACQRFLYWPEAEAAPEQQVNA